MSEESRSFSEGEDVVIREDFHSAYFRGLKAKIAGPARKGGTPEELWPLRLEVEPHSMVIMGKYLRRPDEAILQSEPVEAERESSPEEKKSFLSRIIPWRR